MLDNLKIANLKRWQNMKVNPGSVVTLDKVAARLIAPTAKNRYKAVEDKTGVPWPVIAVTHEREASQSWKANLAQGDPWDRVSTHVPKGQGPFSSWEEAAINAVKEFKWTDWSAGGMLTFLERYNGLGYSNKGKPSPYVWSKTDQYVSGKYVADGVYDANAVDKQMGCAALLMRMMSQDSTIDAKYHWLSTAPVKVAPPVGKIETSTAGAVIVAGGVAATQWTEYLPYIGIGALVAVIAAWLLVRWFKKRSVTNV